MDGRAGATLSLNVLSFQTSFETWTTAAIINWKKLLRLSVVSKLEEISSLRPALLSYDRPSDFTPKDKMWLSASVPVLSCRKCIGTGTALALTSFCWRKSRRPKARMKGKNKKKKENSKDK
tara:strand:- start:635 stop:997 length:363 start_codon:yes stop_codon:yes gene_type:complete